MSEILESKAPCARAPNREALLAGMKACLDQLPPETRRLISLSYVGGLSTAEIAGALAMSRSTVSKRIHEALNMLRKRLLQAGLKQAMPLLNTEGLLQAFDADQRVPDYLEKRILKMIQESPRPMPRIREPRA